MDYLFTQIQSHNLLIASNKEAYKNIFQELEN